CLKAEGDYNGAPVSVVNCTAAEPSNTWTISRDDIFGVGTSTPFKVFGDKCLDVTEGNDADGTRLQIWTCYEGNTNQLWQINPGYYIKWADHNKCIDLTDGLVNNPVSFIVILKVI
ncbi:hypothetical protein CPB86DRAFT_720370, partial [Serendipita vermifera]